VGGGTSGLSSDYTLSFSRLSPSLSRAVGPARTVHIDQPECGSKCKSDPALVLNTGPGGWEQGLGQRQRSVPVPAN
jgi:hypothetical protein